MLAIVASQYKDVVPMMAAHIYSVCPIAIPALPSISADASEDELMDGLGMLKQKDGTYESFSRYIARNEVSRISLS
jgi:GLE1-like protein